MILVFFLGGPVARVIDDAPKRDHVAVFSQCFSVAYQTPYEAEDS